jgi:hypothetical protein
MNKILNYEEMKRNRIQQINKIFKEEFDLEPEEFYFVEGYLRVLKWLGERRKGYPTVVLTIEEIEKCKHEDWRLYVCYDDDELIYWFEKYKETNGKIYKFTVCIYTK